MQHNGIIDSRLHFLLERTDFMSIRTNFNHTIAASYLGYISQAIVVNFAPLLFLTFQSSFSIPLEQITLLVTLNFGLQLFVDFACAKLIHRIGYRTAAIAAHLFIACGLFGMAIFPDLLPSPYIGLLIAVMLYAIGGGIVEVVVSPIVEACPTERKEAAMSLLHSFYCWGCVAVILLSTVFFTLFGIHSWRILSILWALLPAANAVYFAFVPIRTLEESTGTDTPLKKILRAPVFWVFMLLMVCAGASEQAIGQWASAFAESGLRVSKTIGDLAGPCMFAVLMGTSRALYANLSEKIDLTKAMFASGVLCIISYLIATLSPSPALSLVGCGLCGLSVGLFWPGTFSLAAKTLPGSTAMFALFALAGDLGCSVGPTVVGGVSGMFDGSLKTGLLAAIAFPALLCIGLFLYRRHKTHLNNEQ